MPEATVNKQSYPFTAKNKVGSARQLLVSSPACISICPQDGNQFKFGIFVSPGLNRGHDLGPFLF